MLPYPDALERALGQVVARAKSELDLLKERADAAVAAANSRVAEAEHKLLAIDARISERLAELKDGEPGPPGEPGVVDKAEVRAVVEEVVGKLPLPERGEPGQDGKDADMEAVASLIGEHVERAVTALPPAEKGEPGEPGRDADMAVLEGFIAERVQSAAAEIRVPRDGVDGRDGLDVSDIEVTQTGAIVEFGFTVGEVRSYFEVELPAGPPGRDGEPGERGEKGADGATGKLDRVLEWTNQVHYEGQIRAHGGSTYQAARDTGQAPPHEDWILIAAAGSNGTDARSFRIRETWSADEEYLELDVVSLNGGAFVARKDAPGECPGPDWKLLASQGKRGAPGERGAQGPRGPAGPPVAALHISDEGLLTLVNGDGSQVTCDLYPLLSKIDR